MARQVRIEDPMNARKEDFPEIAGLPDEKAERKLAELRSGAELRASFPPMPDTRPCQDVIWVAAFLITAAATLGAGYWYSGNVLEAHPGVTTARALGEGDGASSPSSPSGREVEVPEVVTLIAAGAVGSAGSMLAAFLYMMLAHRAPTCVVYTSLLFAPVFMVFSGLGMIVAGLQYPEGSMLILFGGVSVALGICLGTCTFVCWRHLIPFMIKLTEVVAEVIERHPCLIVISVIGSLMGVLWTSSCGLAFYAIRLEHEEYLRKASGEVIKVLYGLSTLVFVWGAQVCYNVCHVTYCGVFGRWYYKPDEEASALRPAFAVAMTTSLGSICLGSFLVAVVRAVEAIVRSCRQDAAEGGNMVMCVLLCLVECFIRCIGDILEYFNEWAYVQCAIRGTSFCESAKITYSMLTCANVQYITADLLLGSLVSLGAILCGLLGGLFGCVAGFMLEGAVAAVFGGCVALPAGIICGGSSLASISSGIKTILACWADDPKRLEQTHPDIHQEFTDRIYRKINGLGDIRQQ